MVTFCRHFWLAIIYNPASPNSILSKSQNTFWGYMDYFQIESAKGNLLVGYFTMEQNLLAVPI